MLDVMKRHLKDDQGIALVVVIGAIALISGLAVGGYALASQSLHSTTRLQTESVAFQVASSGMDRELATFSQETFLGQASYQKSGSTPDGSYLVTVSRDPALSFRFSIVSTGTAGIEQAAVRQDFFHFDLWATNIASANNPAMGAVGSAAQWNGSQTTVTGPFYVGGDCDFNSNVEFVGGPLFATGNVQVSSGVGFTPIAAGGEAITPKYLLFAGEGCSGAPSNVKVYNTCPKITLPWVDPTYMDAMEAEAGRQSSDNVLGTKPTTNTEVAVQEDANSYTHVRSAGAPAPGPYKVINGDLSIGAATPPFGAIGDDFAYSAGILYVEGVVFVDGNVTIGPGATAYSGNGIIISTGNISVGNGATFQPVTGNGDSDPDDLSPTMCLGLVADNDINLTGGTFEGIVFANGDLNIFMDGGLQGAVHANTINSMQPHTAIYMETNMSPALLPDGTPGSTTDPRGPEAYSGGVRIPGTWSRIQ